MYRAFSYSLHPCEFLVNEFATKGHTALLLNPRYAQTTAAQEQGNRCQTTAFRPAMQDKIISVLNAHILDVET